MVVVVDQGGAVGLDGLLGWAGKEPAMNRTGNGAVGEGGADELRRVPGNRSSVLWLLYPVSCMCT